MQINKICRACLCEGDKMIDMSEKDVYQKFLLFANLTAEEEIPDISLNLCQSCEQKLNSSLDFKEECQKSHETLLKYVRNTRDVVSEATATADVDTPDDIFEESDVDSVEVELEATDAGVKKLSRRVQFPQKKVSKVIKDLEKKFYEKKICIRCGFVANQSRALSQHITCMHKDLKPRWCCVCNAEFDNLTDHVATNHSDTNTCKFCNKKFKKVSTLIYHLHGHSDVKSFQCSRCGKCYGTQRNLSVHLNSHTKERLYKCGSCKKSFIQLYQFKNHLKLHESEGDADKQHSAARHNFCVKCNKKVRSLLAHTKQVHTKSDNHSCMLCGKLFKTATKLKEHMRLHTMEALHKCTYCNKKFKAHNTRINHERTHTGERPHVCQVCGKSFGQPSTLTIHMKIHNVGLKISCKICDKKFCNRTQLRQHLQMHTGEKPYVCNECGRGFGTKNYLVEHNKTHSDLRSYQCNICDKFFKKSDNLKHHMWIHTGEKPYKCSQCSYACRQSYSLTQHMKYHEVDKPQADRPHVCLMCNKTFMTEANLTSHINKHNVSFLEIQT